jgi:glycosyltransferase involved in cell wall biosynthesis
LESVKNQTYKNIEIILIDNFSTDDTREIAKRYTKKVYTKGPERSAQVNFGVKKATGTFVYKIDSDFVLETNVIKECVNLCDINKFDAVVVHNTPDVTVSWIAKIRKFEVDMYKYNLNHSSARFVRKDLYEKVGGFNSAVTAGEDYDFQNKLNHIGAKIGFADSEALHLGEPKHLWPHLKKYYDYGRDFVNYQQVTNKENQSTQLGFFRSVYYTNWRKFISHPFIGFIFFIYNILKYSFGGAGLLVGRLRKR